MSLKVLGFSGVLFVFGVLVCNFGPSKRPQRRFACFYSSYTNQIMFWCVFF